MGKHGYVGERERRGEGEGAIKPDFSQGAYHDGRSGSWGGKEEYSSKRAGIARGGGNKTWCMNVFHFISHLLG